MSLSQLEDALGSLGTSPEGSTQLFRIRTVTAIASDGSPIVNFGSTSLAVPRCGRYAPHVGDRVVLILSPEIGWMILDTIVGVTDPDDQ